MISWDNGRYGGHTADNGHKAADIQKFHLSKSKVLSITNQHNILHNLPFTIFQYRLDSTYIDYVSSYVDSGLTVNNKLLWKEQCDKLVSKGNSQLGMLMRIAHMPFYYEQKTKKNLLSYNREINF